MDGFDAYMRLDAGLAGYLGEFAAAAKPTQPSQPGLTKMSIHTLQTVLNALGERLKVDGLFGPNTRGAWQRQANKYGQNPAFDRAASNVAWVSLQTYQTLSAKAYPVKAATSKPAAPKPAPAPKPAVKVPAGTAVKTVLELQTLLNALGAKLKTDGLFGPKTKSAWATAAARLKVATNFDRVDGKHVRVVQSAYDKIKSAAAAAKKTAPAPAPKPAVKVPAGTVVKTVLELQTLLNALGAKLKTDGLFGPKTKSAWATAAARLKVATNFDRVDGKHVRVIQSAYDKIKSAAAAAKKAAPAPAPASAGTITKSVLELQDLLFGVGWTSKKLTRDGLYGPQTKGAWAVSAKLRKLPTTFERVDGKHARVSQITYDKIKADGAKPTAAAAAPAAAPKPPTGLVDKSVSELQSILYGVGWTTKTLKHDGLYGPKTQSAWAGSAKLRGLPQTFTRVNSKTARVDATTYEALKAKMPATKAEAVKPTTTAAAKPAAGPPAGKIDKSVAELQGILYGVGWTTKTLKNDGLYGPKTKAAWEGSAKLRGLSGAFDRVDGRTARVDATTYEALKAKMPATKVSEAVKEAAAAKARPAPPAGKTDKSVAELQALLYGIGWTTAKLKSDGLYGPKTKSAWQTSAKSRSLPTTFDKIDAHTARVDAVTYEAIKAKMPEGKPAPALPTDLITKPVIDVQKLLQALGWPASTVPVNGNFEPNTQKAWAQATKDKGLDQTFLKVDARTAKLSQKSFTALQNEVEKQKAVVPKPTTTKSGLSPTAQALIKLATYSVGTEALQQAMNFWAGRLNVQPIPITGIWNQDSTELFFKTFGSDIQQASGPTGVGIWREAFPSLISSDGKTVKLSKAYADAVPSLAQAWMTQQQATKPAPLPGPTPPEVPLPAPEAAAPAPLPEAPIPESPQLPELPPPTAEPTAPTGPAPEPFYGEEAPPSAEEFVSPPAAPPSAEQEKQIWAAAAQALQSLTQKAPTYEQALEQAKTRGELHPDVKAEVQAWIDSANKLMADVADLISTSPDLRAALDASGPSVGLAGFQGGYGSELGAFFGGLEAAADTVIEQLRTPLQLPPDLQGLGQEIPVSPQVASLAARLGSATWARLLEVLRLPVVTTAGGVAMAGKAVSDAINGETEAYLSHEQALDQLVAEGKLTIDEYNALKKTPPGKSSVVPFLLGAAAVVAGGVYYVRKHPRGTVRT